MGVWVKGSKRERGKVSVWDRLNMFNVLVFFCFFDCKRRGPELLADCVQNFC